MEMIEVKTADLAGATLDWAVAKAEISPMEMPPKDRVWSKYCATYSPSTDWSQGGPLIQERKVAMRFSALGSDEYWLAEIGEEPFECVEGWMPRKPLMAEQCGDTALIAACRAIVESVLGETVSVPKELVDLTKASGGEA